MLPTSLFAFAVVALSSFSSEAAPTTNRLVKLNSASGGSSITRSGIVPSVSRHALRRPMPLARPVFAVGSDDDNKVEEEDLDMHHRTMRNIDALLGHKPDNRILLPSDRKAIRELEEKQRSSPTVNNAPSEKVNELLTANGRRSLISLFDDLNTSLSSQKIVFENALNTLNDIEKNYGNQKFDKVRDLIMDMADKKAFLIAKQNFIEEVVNAWVYMEFEIEISTRSNPAWKLLSQETRTALQKTVSATRVNMKTIATETLWIETKQLSYGMTRVPMLYGKVKEAYGTVLGKFDALEKDIAFWKCLLTQLELNSRDFSACMPLYIHEKQK